VVEGNSTTRTSLYAVCIAAHCKIRGSGWYATAVRKVGLYAIVETQVSGAWELWLERVEERWALDSAAQRA